MSSDSSKEFILGIDPSATSTGLSLIATDLSEVYVKNISPKKLRDCDRLKFISDQLSDFISDKKVAYCCMESPAYDAVHKEFILGEVLGCIKLSLSLHGVTKIAYASPTQIKKFLAGTGTASKEEMIRNAVANKCPSIQEDICDSWGAVLIAKSLHEGSSVIRTRAAYEVVNSILAKL